LLRRVRWLDKIEPYFDWLHFQGLFKYLTFLGVIAFACQWASPDIGALLAFDRDKILAGEVWRVASFIFTPMGVPGFWSVGVVILFFATRIAFLVSDALESEWGSTRTTLYILVGWLGLVVSHFIFDMRSDMSGVSLYTSLFLAFATLFPRVEFSLMFLIPLQVRIFGWVTGVIMLWNAIFHPYTLLTTVPVMIPYLLWVLPGVIHGRKSLVKASQRRRKFQIASRPESQAFHRCESCGRTERDSEDLEFYTLPDGKEYCQEHLPPQT
jgi:hypothetical protein